MTSSWFGLGSDDAGDQSADVAIFGVPYDGAVFFRAGAAQGPGRIRELSSKLPPCSERGRSLSHLRVLDLGDVAPSSGDEPVEALHERVRGTFRTARSRALPLALGGDHSISIPLFAAAAEAADKPYAVIWIDAHPDLCDNYLGSPLSHACVLRRALDHPHLDPANVIMLGTRSFELEEIAYIRDSSLSMLTAHDLASRPASEIADFVLDRIGSLPTYLSIDIDAFDPAYAPGTGIPDAGGLSTRWVLDFLHGIGQLNLLGVDIVEVAPPLDVASDATSLLALKLILELLDAVFD